MPAPDKAPDYAIEVENLEKVYAASGKMPEKRALKSISLKIPRGSIFGLLGPNGAGKSTFINILAGLVTKTSGSAKIWGYEVEENPRMAKAAIGVVPQELNIDPFFTPEEMLDVQAGLYGVPKAERRTDEILEMVGLSDKADAYARTLSGGMRRRLLIGKAMVHFPPILVLDEPTAGVDIELRQQLWENVVELNKQGVTILLTTHYLEEAEELCDRIAIINQGNSITEASTGIAGLTVKPSKGNGASQLSSIDTGTEIITTQSAHGYKTGEAITIFTPGTAPGGLTAGSTTYYVRSIGSNTFTLHPSEADATNNTNISNITSSGSGDVYFLGTSPTGATVTIAKDTQKIKTAIDDLVNQYNSIQKGIAEHVKITTAADGKVTTSTLSDERLVAEITSSLRTKIMGDVDSAQITGTIKRLESLGYTSNGYDNTITLGDSSKLDTALREKIGDVKAFFSTTDYGYGDVVDNYLETLIGESLESGSLVDRRDNLTKAADDIDTQIERLERQVQANRQKMIDSFVNMELAQAKINSQMQFIMARFSNNNSN